MPKSRPESRAVMTMYDEPMWDSIGERRWALQCCSRCSTFRYPPAPNCPECLSLDFEWKALCGDGTILSWVIFHREYLPEYKPPYNVVAVQLAEGPIVVSNLIGNEPQGSWIDQKVKITYAADQAGHLLPKMQLG